MQGTARLVEKGQAYQMARWSRAVFRMRHQFQDCDKRKEHIFHHVTVHVYVSLCVVRVNAGAELVDDDRNLI